MNEARRPVPIKLNVTANGSGTIEIGGRKFENYIAGFTVVSRVGEPTRIYLDLIAAEGLQAQLDALVDVVIHDPTAETKVST